MARVLIRPQAAREFLSAATYLAREASPGVARRFQRSLAKTLERIAETPDLGSPWESDNPRLAGVRYRQVHRFPRYLIFYQTTDDTIEVLHLLHGSRDIENILEPE